MSEERRVLEGVLKRTREEREKARLAAKALPILEKQIEGLELAIGSLNGASPAQVPPTTNEPKAGIEIEWSDLNRAQAILRVMKGASEALSPAQISRILHRHGRTDSADAVSIRLGKLKASGLVTNVGYAQWVVTDGAPKD